MPTKTEKVWDAEALFWVFAVTVMSVFPLAPAAGLKVRNWLVPTPPNAMLLSGMRLGLLDTAEKVRPQFTLGVKLTMPSVGAELVDSAMAVAGIGARLTWLGSTQMRTGAGAETGSVGAPGPLAAAAVKAR